MRIAQVTPFFHPHIGGVESHVLTLSQKLVSKGHEVTVYTSQHEDTNSNENFQGIDIVRSRQVANLFTTPVTPSLKKILASGDHDVVHSHTPPPLTAYYAARACKRSKTPFVITYHCDLELPSAIGKLATAIYQRTLGRYTYGRAQRIIVHTKTYGATSRTIWKSEPVVVPSAVNPERFGGSVDYNSIIEKHDLKDKQRILFVGRLVSHKGVDYLVDSAKLTKENVRYIIVGTGDYLENLKKRAHDDGVSHKIIFAGNVSYDDLPKYFMASDIFVLPSISRLEAFGLVVLEAMSSRRPVIVSKIPGVSELVEDGLNGYHAEPMNPEDLAEKINMLLSDPELRRKMGEAGRKKVETEFNWDTVASQVEDVYKGLIKD